MTYICLFIIIGCGFIVDHLISTNIVPVIFVLDPSYLSTIFSASITLAGFGIAVVSLLPNSFDKTYYGYSMKEIIHMKESNVSINTFIKVTFLCMAFGLLGLILASYNLITAVFIFLLFVNFNYFRKIFKIITNDLECKHIVTTYIETRSSKTNSPSLKDEINIHLLNYLSDLSRTTSTEQKDAVWNMFWDFNKEIWSKLSDNTKPTEQQINACSDFTNKILNLYTPSADSTLFSSYLKTILAENELSSEQKTNLIEHGLSAIKFLDYTTLSSVNLPKQIRKFKLQSNSEFGIEDLYKIYIRNVLAHPNISQDEKIQLIANLFIVISAANNTENCIENESCEIEKKVLYDTINNHLLHYADLENAKIVLSSFISFIAEVKGYNSYRTYDITNEIAKIYATAIYALFIPFDFYGRPYFLIDQPTTNLQKKNLYNLFYDVSCKQLRNNCMFFDLLYCENNTPFGWEVLEKMTSWLSSNFWVDTDYSDSPWYDHITFYNKNARSWAYTHIILYLLYYHIRISTDHINIFKYSSIFETYENWELLSHLDGINFKPIIFSLYSVFQITNRISLKNDFYQLFKKLLDISIPNHRIQLNFVKIAFETINAEKAKYYSAPWLSEPFDSTAEDWRSVMDPFQFDTNANHVLINETKMNLLFTSLVDYPCPITRKEIILYLFKKTLLVIRSYLDKELEATSDINKIKENCKKLNITHCSFELIDIGQKTNVAKITDEFRKEISPLLEQLSKIDHQKWNGFYFFNKELMKFYFSVSVDVTQNITDKEIKEKIDKLPRFGDKFFYQTFFFSVLLSYEEAVQTIKNENTEYHITYTVKTSINKDNAFRIDAARSNVFTKF